MCFPAYDEDYGFVTVEAFAARKAVVTCTDSGGPAELVRDGVEGFVTAPTPEALGAGAGPAGRRRAVAREMGEAGSARRPRMTWAKVVERLVIV